MRRRSAAPSGLMTVLVASPTAHAVGYDLPPSGLKPESPSMTFPSPEQQTSLAGVRHRMRTSPKHRMSLVTWLEARDHAADVQFFVASGQSDISHHRLQQRFAIGFELTDFATEACNERGNTTKYGECTLLAKAQNKPLHFTTDRIIFAIGSVYTPRGLKLTHLRPQHTNPKRKRGCELRPR